MPATLIYEHSNGGELWQGGIDDVPVERERGDSDYDKVFYMAVEQPPLDQFGLWAPMADVEDPRAYGEQTAAAKAAAYAIWQSIVRGEVVLVTCQMGVNRSSTATGLALKKLGVPNPVEWIRERRPRTLTNRQLERIVRDESV